MRIKTRTLENEIARRAMSYKDIAMLAGITERTLQAARNGSEIRTATAGRIAAALGVDVETLTKEQQNNE